MDDGLNGSGTGGRALTTAEEEDQEEAEAEEYMDLDVHMLV